MTTTAKPKAKQHDDLKHGPVAVAFNTSVVPLMFAAIGKATGGIPPWVPLVAGVGAAICLAIAGHHRQPRPLSRSSLTYRALVALAAAGWLWWQLATFTPIGMPAGQMVALLIAWPSVVVALLIAVARPRLRVRDRLLVTVVPLLIAAGLTCIQRDAVSSWLNAALTVTNRFADRSDVLPWLGYAVLSLIVMAVPTAILGVVFGNRERSADEELARQQQKDLPRSAAGEAAKFQREICKLTNEITEIRPADPYQPGRRVYTLGITSVEFWGNGAGETYVIDMRNNQRGTTRDTLRSHADQIATRQNLPYGCGVEVLPARDTQGEPLGQGFAAMKISRVNVLKLTIPYPELQQRSILNAMPLGRTRSDQEIGPYLRENSAYLWGQKGSGKTGTIYDIITGAMQCTDCLVWVIDLNRGNAARPFLRAFGDGRVNRPCIDWVATTMHEVALMAEVGLRMALDRKSFYADLKFDEDTNLMPVGNGAPGQPPPEVLIVIDEGANVLGTGGEQMTDEGRAARDALNQIMNLARDAAINIVFSGLRATSDVADTAFMRGTSVRIGMRVTDDAELAHGFGDWKLSGKQIPYKGSGYIRTGHAGEDEDAGDDIQVFKAYYLAPKRMDSIGVQVTPWRPFLDERSRRVGGIVYANRWRRTAPLLWDNPRPEVCEYGTQLVADDPNTIDGDFVDTTAPVTAAAGPPDSETMVGADRLAAGLSKPTGGSFEDMIAAAKQQAAARAALSKQGDGEQPTAAATPAPPPDPAPAPAADPSPTPPPPAPPARDPIVLSDDEIKGKFEDLAERLDPGWNPPARTMDEQALTANRELIEKIVRVYGPITAGDLYDKLKAGGKHGPAVDITKVWMHKLLKKPGTSEPADWLAPRQPGDPYTHRDVSG